MNVVELIKIREDILNASTGQDGFVSEQDVLSEVLPMMLDAKLVDSEDYNDAYFLWDNDDIKINGYAVNESSERLQLFLIDESFVKPAQDQDDLLVSERSVYEKQFKRASRFVRNAFDGTLVERMQDADPAKALAMHLASANGIDQFDVIEVFLVTLSATVSRKGKDLQARDIHFDKDTVKVVHRDDQGARRKEILFLRRVVDLNFVHNVNVSRGNREPLTIDFVRDFDTRIEVIQAAGETNFESYLCVLSADVLSDLYRLHSSRLLEKNVRSFLQFRGANRGMRDTIRESPEKFIAYNNGLTITATDASIVMHKKKTYLESLADFQIVNGGQTTASLYFSRKDGLDIRQIRVMAKINVVKTEKEDELDDLISNISKFSNTQSKVSTVDLRSRNPALRALKSLSNSITTPSGHRWFFERTKGEFATQVRVAGGQKASFEKKYPRSRRFSKTELGKFFTAWGDQPHVVKKGGEKVFRHFLEILSPEDDAAPSVPIDRDFYEGLIGKIILFREMEKIYGQGKNAMGQIRSAAIPYAIASIYIHTDGSEGSANFNFEKIWADEGLEEALEQYLKDLLKLVNSLIKQYALSDDLGEYSKKVELWEAIKKSPELSEFMASENTKRILSRYSAQAR